MPRRDPADSSDPDVALVLAAYAAFAEYLAASRAMWRELISEPTAYRHGDEIVVVHHVHGTLADGTAHEATVADVFSVGAGTIVRMRAYADPAQAFLPHPQGQPRR